MKKLLIIASIMICAELSQLYASGTASAQPQAQQFGSQFRNRRKQGAQQQPQLPLLTSNADISAAFDALSSSIQALPANPTQAQLQAIAQQIKQASKSFVKLNLAPLMQNQGQNKKRPNGKKGQGRMMQQQQPMISASSADSAA